MSRWLLMSMCAWALACGASAQDDDLDALLAGLGDEPAAEVAAPAEAPATAEAPAPVEDPFADLLAAPAEEEPADAKTSAKKGR